VNSVAELLPSTMATLLPNVFHPHGTGVEAATDDNEKTLRFREFYRRSLLAHNFDSRDAKAFEVIARWLSVRWQGKAKVGLLLRGVPGCGKTTAAQAICAHLGCKMILARSLPAWFEDKDVPWRDRVTPVAYVGAFVGGKHMLDLIIDDMGIERQSSVYGSKVDAMIELLDDRYDAFKSYGNLTIITTNLDRRLIANRYGERIASRLDEMCWPIDFLPIDHRQG